MHVGVIHEVKKVDFSAFSIKTDPFTLRRYFRRQVFLHSRQTPDMSSSCDVLLTPYVSYRPLEPRPWRFPSWLMTGSWHKWHYAPHRCSRECSTRTHRTEYHLHGAIIGTVLRFSWSVSQARKQSRRRKRCLCARKVLQVTDNGHLKKHGWIKICISHSECEDCYPVWFSIT